MLHPIRIPVNFYPTILYKPIQVYLQTSRKLLVIHSCNKSSTVAEMADLAREKWAEKWGDAVPLSVGRRCWISI